jgi:hypothetical protein
MQVNAESAERRQEHKKKGKTKASKMKPFDFEARIGISTMWWS